MKKQVLITVIFAFSYLLTLAQQSNLDSILETHSKSFELIFNEKVHLEDMQICEGGVYFIKYKLKKDGDIAQVSYSQNMLSILKDTIQKVLIKNSELFLIRSKFRIDTTQVVLVPLYINMSNCSGLDQPYPGYTKPVMDTSKASNNVSLDVIKRINEAIEKTPFSVSEYLFKRFALSASSLFKFDDKEFKFNHEYKILSPIYLVSLK